MVLPRGNGDVAALGNEQRVPERVGLALEDRRHLSRSLQEELVAVVPQALRVVDRLPCANAQQDVVRLIVVLPQVVHVVGGHQRQIQFPGQRQDAAVHRFLLLEALILHFQEEVLRAENVAQARRRLERGPRLVHPEGAGHLPLEAAA